MKTFILILIAALTCFVSINADTPSGQQNITVESFTGTGRIKAGCWGLTLITNASFAGNVGGGGGTLPVSSIIVVPVPAYGRLADVYVNVTGGTLTALEVR